MADKETEGVLTFKNINKQELEDQYSGSRWSTRFSKDEIIPEYIQFSEKMAKKVKKIVPHQLDIAYAEKASTKLDLFGTDLPNGSPILVFFHGGYWQELKKELAANHVLPLYRNNIINVVVGYTLAPKANVAEIVEEARCAVKWSCNLAKTKKSSVYLMGWSAGAQLITQVMSTAEEKDMYSDIKGLFTLSGVFDITPLVPTYINALLKMDCKTSFSLSPMFRIAELACHFAHLKIHCFFGRSESDAFKRQSREYAEKLKARGIAAWCTEVEAVDHFNIIEDLSREDFLITQSLIKLIK